VGAPVDHRADRPPPGRRADLAVAAWSTEWNYGPSYDGLVYSGYGVAPDAERIAYYRRLWDAG
jgi:kanamycin kinase